MRSIPDPNEVLTQLSPILSILFQTIEEAVLWTKDFFEGNTREVDPSLAPNMVCYYAKDALRKRGQAVEDDIGMEPLANNGLMLTYGGMAVRILKADNGSLPPPGYSRARQAFYHQQYALDFPSAKGIYRPSMLNLILLWNADPGYVFQGLTLSCPKGGDTRRSSVEEYWRVPVPHPVLLLEDRPVKSDVEPAEDLPLDFKKKETGTEPEDDN